MLCGMSYMPLFWSDCRRARLLASAPRMVMQTSLTASIMTSR
nr:MAG TPA: hypothetical protein [Caudoviricetes sp.]